MTTVVNRTRAVVLTAGLAAGSFLIGGVLVFFGANLLMLFGIPVTDRPVIRLSLSIILLQGVTFIGTTLLYLTVREPGAKFITARFPTRRDIGWMLGGTVGLFLALGATSGVLSMFGLESAQNRILEMGRQNPTVFIVMAIWSFLLVGPGEELMFRGVVQGILRKSFSAVPAIILASLIFGVPHLFSLLGDGKLTSIAVVAVLSMVLGAAYEYTNNLVVPIGIHAVFNAVQFGMAYYAVTQGLSLVIVS